MLLNRIFLTALLIANTAAAQLPEDELRAMITALRYPPLAEAVRVWGDVHIRLHEGKATLLDGPPLLAESARLNAQSFASLEQATDVDVTYHFVFAELSASAPTTVTLRKGNVFGRVLLRALGLKTEKTVLQHPCRNTDPPRPTEWKASVGAIEIRVYGRNLCIMTETGTTLARR